MNDSCLACQFKTAKSLASKFGSESKFTKDFLTEADYIIKHSNSISSPYLSLLIHRLAKRNFKTEDLYKEEKEKANHLLYSQFKFWNNAISQSDNSFHLAAKLAVIGNIIDYGAHTAPVDINECVNSLLEKEISIDDSLYLQKAVQKAKTVLYLGDNAGEIVFDKLFIKHLNHPNVIYVVRDQPIINDVTLEDANYVEMEDVCKVISNGHDAPSTLLANCSSELQNLFRTADVVISKGQGNFEGLLNEKRGNLFFMLLAKCDLIADKLGVEIGDLLIKKA